MYIYIDAICRYFWRLHSYFFKIPRPQFVVLPPPPSSGWDSRWFCMILLQKRLEKWGQSQIISQMLYVWIICLHVVKNSYMNKRRWLGKYSRAMEHPGISQEKSGQEKHRRLASLIARIGGGKAFFFMPAHTAQSPVKALEINEFSVVTHRVCDECPNLNITKTGGLY